VTDDFDIAKFFRYGLKKGYGYELKVWLVVLGLLPSLVLAGVAGLEYGFGEHFYLVCDAPRCENPFHASYLNGVNVKATPKEMLAYSDQQYFEEGFTIGQKVPALVTWAWWLLLPGFIIALLINHFAYNRRGKG